MPKQRDATRAKEVMSQLDSLVKKYGHDDVRWAFNKMSKAMKLREKLRKEKKRVDSELEKIEAQFR